MRDLRNPNKPFPFQCLDKRTSLFFRNEERVLRPAVGFALAIQVHALAAVHKHPLDSRGNDERCKSAYIAALVNLVVQVNLHRLADIGRPHSQVAHATKDPQVVVRDDMIVFDVFPHDCVSIQFPNLLLFQCRLVFKTQC